MMRVEATSKQENLLTYLSETLNGCLTLSESIHSRRKNDFHKVQVAINELFTLYQATKLFYFLSESGQKDVNILEFFTVFDEFYFELKHAYLYEGSTFKRDFTRVEELKGQLVELFEKIVESMQKSKAE